MEQVGVQVERVARLVDLGRREAEPEVGGRAGRAQLLGDLDPPRQVSALRLAGDLARVAEQVAVARVGELDSERIRVRVQV